MQLIRAVQARSGRSSRSGIGIAETSGCVWIIPVCLALVTGCPSVSAPGDPQIDSIEAFRHSGLAVARVYAAAIPFTGADHTWFVIKRADSTEIRRWEVFVTPDGVYGYVYADLFAPEADLGAGGTRVVAEVVGPDAEALIDCIEAKAANYPCSDYYVLFPGPNSDSFTQWVLDSCGWEVPLGENVIGKDVRCPFAD